MNPHRTTRPVYLAPASTDEQDLRPLLVFVSVALGVGGLLFTLSTLIDPGEPFLMAALLFGLVLPALVLTHREGGWGGVRALLRDCVRMPTPWWWLPVAGLGLPAVAWTMATLLGGAQVLTWSSLGSYLADLLVGAIVINIWEEMAWTGYLQRRAMARWGTTGGSLITAVFFTGIHLPLAVDGTTSPGQVATNVLTIAGVAVGLRLLIGRVDPWTGGSLLTIGILHSSFNATEALLQPGYDWVRLVTTIAVAIALVAFGARPVSGLAGSPGYPGNPALPGACNPREVRANPGKQGTVTPAPLR